MWTSKAILGAALALALGGCGSGQESLRFELNPDTRRVYRLQYSNRSLSDLRPFFGQSEAASAPGLAHTFHAELEGTLTLEVRPDRRVQIWVEPESLAFEADGDSEPATLAALKRELPIGARLEFESNGHLKSVAVPKGAHRVVTGLLQALAVRLQWTCPIPPAQEWTAREPDPNGTLLVSYRATSADGSTRVRQTRVRLELASGSGAETAEVKGMANLDFERGFGLPAKVSLSDRVDLLRSGRPIGVSETKLELKTVAKGDTAKAAVARLRQNASQVEYAVVLGVGEVEIETDRRAMETARLAGRTPAQVWEGFVGAKDVAKGSADVYLALKALLYLRPSECERARKELAQAARKELAQAARRPFAFSTLAEALADAGHAEAQRALREALADFHDDERPAAALIAAMGGLREPELATIEALKETAKGSSGLRADTALLALGRLANAEGKPSRYDGRPVVKWLITQFADAASADRRSVACLALGNSGRAEAAGTVLTAARSSDAGLRASAATSLRWMPSSEADETLRFLLKTDPSLEVRRRAASALGFRMAPENRDALIAAAQDPNPSVRLAALSTLFTWSPRGPEISACFVRAMADPDDDVRRLAKSFEGSSGEGSEGPKPP